MKKVNLYYGNQHEVIDLDKKDPVKVKSVKKIGFMNRILNWIDKKYRKFTVVGLKVSVVVWLMVGSVAFMQSNHPKVVLANKEVIVTQTLKFEDIPMLVKICNAESGGHQFKKNGDVLRGIVNPSDIGYCQISEYIWNDTARKMGMDIYTEKGNKDFAIWLFLRQGSAPWNSSRAGWSK